MPIVSAIFAVSMLSAALHASHYKLSRIRENVIFATYTRPNIGINYRRIRRVAGWALAFCPWLGLAAGFGIGRL